LVHGYHNITHLELVILKHRDCEKHLREQFLREPPSFCNSSMGPWLERQSGALAGKAEWGLGCNYIMGWTTQWTREIVIPGVDQEDIAPSQ
jgi:hypothetical protein